LESDVEVEAFQTFLVQNSPEFALSMMLRLSLWERIRWALGRRLSQREVAHRIFSFVDLNGDGCLPIGILDVLVKHLQSHLNFGKATLEIVEV
jgi:hypothetical protein